MCPYPPPTPSFSGLYLLRIAPEGTSGYYIDTKEEKLLAITGRNPRTAVGFTENNEFIMNVRQDDAEQ